MTRTNYQIIVAAGTGSRYGGDLPKQFCLLGGRPMLMTTIERIAAGTDARVILVLSSGMVEMWKDMCAGYGFTLPHEIVEGGATRAHSVRNAVMSVAGQPLGWISVHDAARPMADAVIMDRLTGALDRGYVGAIPVVSVTDSLRLVSPDGSSHSVDRSLYRAVQTPQVFDGPSLVEAYSHEILPQFTDEASVMEHAGFTGIALVDGDPSNIKVTNPGDMARVEAMLGK